MRFWLAVVDHARTSGVEGQQKGRRCLKSPHCFRRLLLLSMLRWKPCRCTTTAAIVVPRVRPNRLAGHSVWRFWGEEVGSGKADIGRQKEEGRRSLECWWPCYCCCCSGASGGLLWFVSCVVVVVLLFGGCLYVCLRLTATQAVKAMHMFWKMKKYGSSTKY